MEHPIQEQNESHDNPLAVFQQEIAEIKANERRMREETGSGIHLDDVDTSELVDDDRIVWGLYKDRALTQHIMQKYGDDMRESNPTRSRRDFAAFLRNKIVAWNLDGTMV